MNAIDTATKPLKLLGRHKIKIARTVGKFKSGQDVLLHVANDIFNPYFLVGLAYNAGPGFNGVMNGKVELMRKEDRLLASKVAPAPAFRLSKLMCRRKNLNAF